MDKFLGILLCSNISTVRYECTEYDRKRKKNGHRDKQEHQWILYFAGVHRFLAAFKSTKHILIAYSLLNGIITLAYLIDGGGGLD